MAYLRGFGCYLPERRVDNQELASQTGVDPAWLLEVTGIEQRRYAAEGETPASLGILAAKDCLEASGVAGAEIGLVLVACGSTERRFPGPATEVAAGLVGMGVKPETPAIDLPLASAGSLFAISLANSLCREYGNVLVVATEVMSRVVRRDPEGKDTAILFGDGAGACVVSAESGVARIVDSVIHSDGEFASALRLGLGTPIEMDGRTIILQAARKLPRGIQEVLDRGGVPAGQVGTFLMHQANLNLITRVAKALGVPASRFFCNIQKYGNTSSASLLIAAAEWWREAGQKTTDPIVLAAFGSGLNWGAVLAVPQAGA